MKVETAHFSEAS